MKHIDAEYRDLSLEAKARILDLAMEIVTYETTLKPQVEHMFHAVARDTQAILHLDERSRLVKLRPELENWIVECSKPILRYYCSGVDEHLDEIFGDGTSTTINRKQFYR